MAEFSAPWGVGGPDGAGQPLPDDRYARLFSLYGDPGGVLRVADLPSPGFTSINAQANALVVSPLEAVARGRYYRSDAPITVTPDPPASQRRIDRVVIRFDPNAGSASLAIVQGTPAASAITSPPIPALTQTFDGVWEVPLARVTVNPSAPTLSNLVEDPTFAGRSVVPAYARSRPGTNGMERPQRGQPIWDLDYRTLLVWDDGQWVHADGWRSGARFRDWHRGSGPAFDEYASGRLVQQLSGSWASAPAGSYMVSVTLILSTVFPDTTSAGTMRIRVNTAATNWVTDIRADLDSLPRPHRHDVPIQHTGGTLSAYVWHQSNSVNGRIHNSGSRLTISYLGPS